MRPTGLKFYFAVAVLSAVCVSASRINEVTLVVVPRTDESVKLGLDIAGKFPTLLVSYKAGSNGQISLHGWTGSQWVNVSLEDYAAGNFFRTGPDSALLVMDDENVLPEALVPPVDWCTGVYSISTTETRPLLHLIGQYYDFNYADWKWFAKRYDMDVAAINPEGLNMAWYHKRLKDHLSTQEVTGSNDLQYWVVVRTPDAVTEPAAQEPAVEPAEAEGVPVEELESNPLTNSVPEAVVLGAGDAEEAESVVEESKEEASEATPPEQPEEESGETDPVDVEEPKA
jgi:hypothetical protein